MFFFLVWFLNISFKTETRVVPSFVITICIFRKYFWTQILFHNLASQINFVTLHDFDIFLVSIKIQYLLCLGNRYWFIIWFDNFFPRKSEIKYNPFFGLVRLESKKTTIPLTSWNENNSNYFFFSFFIFFCEERRIFCTFENTFGFQEPS